MYSEKHLYFKNENHQIIKIPGDVQIDVEKSIIAQNVDGDKKFYEWLKFMNFKNGEIIRYQEEKEVVIKKIGFGLIQLNSNYLKKTTNSNNGIILGFILIIVGIFLIVLGLNTLFDWAWPAIILGIIIFVFGIIVAKS